MREFPSAPVDPKAGRTTVAHARNLSGRIDDLRQSRDWIRRAVAQAAAAVRAESLEDALAALPVERLRDLAPRVRIAALSHAGYRSVADVLHAHPAQLERLPGIGPQSALQAVEAATRVRSAVEADATVRLDPERRPHSHGVLLDALSRHERVESAFASIGSDAERVSDQIDPLLTPASRACSRLRRLVSRSKAEDRAALVQLGEILQCREVEQLEHDLVDLLDAVETADAPADLWRDFERRSADFYARLGQVGEMPSDIESARGFVVAEIAEQADELVLDLRALRVTLRGYQAFGAKFALERRRVVLGDEMGLGKTIEALAAMSHLSGNGGTHFLVVCPGSVLPNWDKEISTHSALRPIRVHGPRKETAFDAWRSDGGVAVTTYETLRRFPVPPDLGLSMLVVDEAHYVKNPDAKRTKAVRAWAAPAANVLFMTGTPMENRVDEFRNLVRYLQPDVARRLQTDRGLHGSTAFRRAVSPVYLRRNQVDVLSELPDKLENDDWVSLGADDGAAYRRAVEDGNFMAMRRAAYLTPHPEKSAKVARLVDIVDESEANGWKVVFFSFFRDVLDVVDDVLGDAVVGQLHGGVSPSARQEIIDEFGAIDGHAVLIGQIDVGGVGLNLQAASVVVLGEPQWKPSTENQAIARCHRMGQVRRVHVHRLLAEDTVDGHLRRILHRKTELFEAYARHSDAKLASPDALATGDHHPVDAPATRAELEQTIVEAERRRLGVTAA